MTGTLIIALVIVIHVWLLLITLLRINSNITLLNNRAREQSDRLLQLIEILEIRERHAKKQPEPELPPEVILEIKGRRGPEEFIMSQQFGRLNKGQTSTVQFMPQVNLDWLEVEIAEPYFITEARIGAESIAGSNTLATRKFKITPRTNTLGNCLTFTVFRPH